jgi:Putative transposase
VLRSLGQYVHRVAISNPRLLSFEDGMRCFRYIENAHGRRGRTTTPSSLEFVRRLLNALQTGFMRIHRYDVLANLHRHAKLA